MTGCPGPGTGRTRRPG